jgi:PIN domain
VSTTARVRDHVGSIVDRLSALIAQIPVVERQRTGGVVVYVGPDFHWGDLSPEHQAFQLELKREFDPLSELMRLLLHGASKELLERLDDADKHFREWLELQGWNWSLSCNTDRNVQAMRSSAEELGAILDVLEYTGSKELILVPDTNSLLGTSDPVTYRSVEDSPFRFVLLPTVLGELDTLKTEHRNPDVRDKAKAAIKRVRGWRDQGPLLSGVTVDGTIVVQAIHREPDMETTLSWLDPTVKDDRILASVLELQAENPAARVVLVTGDINLQNKADAALVETATLA